MQKAVGLTKLTAYFSKLTGGTLIYRKTLVPDKPLL